MIIEDFHENKVNIAEIVLLKNLKKIYQEKKYAEYVGGSLCFYIDNIFLVFNVDTHITDHVDYWISKLYIKNKTDGHCYWNDAKRIVEQFEKNIKLVEKENALIYYYWVDFLVCCTYCGCTLFIVLLCSRRKSRVCSWSNNCLYCIIAIL
jgi:hypothetical protein